MNKQAYISFFTILVHSPQNSEIQGPRFHTDFLRNSPFLSHKYLSVDHTRSGNERPLPRRPGTGYLTDKSLGLSAEHPELFEKFKISNQQFFVWRYDSIRATEVLDDSSLDEPSRANLQGKIDHSARRTLKVAAVLPLIMAVAFTAILLWFRTQGGYRVLHIGPTRE